jgi:hypothetical protein
MASSGRGAAGSNPGHRIGRYETPCCGVLGCDGGVGGEDHLYPEAPHFFGDGPHLRAALAGGDVPNVDREDASGMLAHRLAVDLRVLLTGVPDQDEGQLGVGAQQLADDPEFVRLVLPRAIGLQSLRKSGPAGTPCTLRKSSSTS